MILSYGTADSVEPPSLDAHTFARIGFGRRHLRSEDPRALTVGLAPLGPNQPFEHWGVERIEDLGWEGGMGFVEGEDLMLVHRLIEDTDRDALAATTETLYGEMLELTARRGYPHPLRIWNLVDSIHDPADGQEGYRAFSAGRANAFDHAGFGVERIPAASAIGAHCEGLLVYGLFARSPGTAVENPRQVPAYRYPPEYGIRPPYFARAMQGTGGLLDTFFISGTASVVGHASNHPDQPEAQLTETLRNLETLIEAAGAPGGCRPNLLRVYVRAPHDIDRIEPPLRRWCGPATRIQYLRGDICRRDLAIEIEGVLQPCDAPS
ncbi:pteridine-dependent deoxygenase like protein [Thiorhodococcus fuscus]|uniref:Pteridine-dependent deoxygenase like protein n=1 Tax=Thiorhodococcus fuscus TaxID=527200 RepID=A0ABW4YBZ9_9GAMM